MDYLWSPWRYDYVASLGSVPSSCPFCVGVDTASDKDRLVVYRGTHSFIIMNLYPYGQGHLLIAPYAHMAKLDDAGPDLMAEMMSLAQRSIGVLRSLYNPEGFNLGMNLGHCAGAGVREHMHMHVVPRWIGDQNFMRVAGETRVLAEELNTTYRRLAEAF